MKLNMYQFKGVAPKIDPALLPETMAQRARDMDLSSGAMLPDRQDKHIRVVPTDTQSIYLYNGTDWYYWNKPVKVIRDFVYDDSFDRIIIQGADDELLITDSALLARSKDLTTIDRRNALVLGLPRLDSFTMTVNGTGTENVDTRSYVVALVRVWNDGKIDIGGLSDPAKTASGEITVDVADGQTVTLSNIVVPSSAMADTGSSKLYIYRSEIGTESATYSFVSEINLVSGTTTYSFTDDKKGTELGEAAISQIWDAPLSGLKGLTTLNNGVVAAYKDQTVYFSFPYQPYAFPATYSVTIDAPIVGLGAFGNTVVVCTKSYPVMLLVADPAAVTVTPIQQSIPCLSEASIANTASGVLYLTSNGVAQIDSYTYNLITKDIISKSSYDGIAPYDMQSVVYDNKYYTSFADGSREFGFRLDLDNITNGIITFSERYKTFWLDDNTAILYATKMEGVSAPAVPINEVAIPELAIVEIGSETEYYKNCFWKSKLFLSNQGVSTMSAARIDADYQRAEIIIPELTYTPVNNSIGATRVNEYVIAGTSNNQKYVDSLLSTFPVVFSYIVDNKLRYTKYCDSNRPFRLPSGFRGRQTEIQVETRVPIRQIDIASSMGELS